ncbi:MAG TPA: lysophospholipid acyltransferase family protein [Chthoniobacteraceae bacterium]|jgi:lauroyl/myristoyl acyltransferase
MSVWKRFRYRLEELGCRFLAGTIPRLSRANCLRLAKVLGAAAWTCDGRGREVALSNVACALPESSDAERARIVRGSYQNFARTMLDLFWGQNLTRENYRDYLVLEGFEELRVRHEQSGGGAVWLGVHHGNFEWGSLACGFYGFANTAVAENFKNPRLSAIFSELRQVSGHTIIPQENSMLRLLKAVKRGGATEMLVDLTLHPTQAATVIEAFGMKMCVTMLHAVLAQRIGALLVPFETEPLADGRCRVIAHEPVEWPEGASVQEIAQRCWDRFEPIIRARPEQWLWPYKHFRYRPEDGVAEYPAYANRSGKFEKLLREIVEGSAKVGKGRTRV